MNVVDENTKLDNESKDVIVHRSKDIVHESDYDINENIIVKKSDCMGSHRNFLGECKDMSSQCDDEL